jgi:hypothetical protein
MMKNFLCPSKTFFVLAKLSLPYQKLSLFYQKLSLFYQTSLPYRKFSFSFHGELTGHCPSLLKFTAIGAAKLKKRSMDIFPAPAIAIHINNMR